MYSKYRLLLDKKEAEVLILGNSHTFFGINPEKSSYSMINLANKGRKIETDYHILKENIHKIENIKYVIIPISHCKMHATPLGEQEKRLYYNYYKLEEYKQVFYKNSLVLNEPFRELIDDMFFKNNKINNLGWRASKAVYKRDTIAIKKRLKLSEPSIYNGENVFCNLELIIEMKNLCLQNNKKLILLVPPYHPDYYEFSNVVYQKNVISQLKKLSERERIIFVNGRDLNIVNDNLFENSDHLNMNGATIFTQKLDSILKLN
tara:strand:+ start:3506 stop:4291 length:786 start_codon:yes stop_codon:yes gene_type:complete